MFRQRLQGRFHFQQSSSHPQVVVERKMLLLKYPKTSQQGECGGKKSIAFTEVWNQYDYKKLEKSPGKWFTQHLCRGTPPIHPFWASLVTSAGALDPSDLQITN